MAYKMWDAAGNEVALNNWLDPAVKPLEAIR